MGRLAALGAGEAPTTGVNGVNQHPQGFAAAATFQHGVTVVVERTAHFHRLPAIGILHLPCPRLYHLYGRVGGLILGIGVVVFLVGAIFGAHLQYTLGDVIAQCCRRSGTVVNGMIAVVVPVFRHHIPETRHYP